MQINNFRGIKVFDEIFDKNFICLIGRGDTGKSTILDAISLVLSPDWNPTFYDSDFYNCDISNHIEIEVSLVDLPNKILKENKFGLYIRGLDRRNDAISDEIDDQHEKLLTIKLEVKNDLEPKWFVVNSRQEPTPITAYERAKLNVYKISDYMDRHFSWSKGNPLFALLRLQEDEEKADEGNIVIDALRDAKRKIDSADFDRLKKTADIVEKKASDFGIDISGIKTSIDFKDIQVKDGRVCLHDEKIPFKLKGKGSKRLISIAIQSAISQQGGITLIDEIEQGLEPDRIRHLVNMLKTESVNGQTFITTHSADVVEELVPLDLGIVSIVEGEVSLKFVDKELQNVVRSCSRAFFAKKIIVCEGKTEIGICMALNNYRKNDNKEYMSYQGCVFVEGNGSTFIEYSKKFNSLGFSTLVFCDSDDPGINGKKEVLKSAGITVLDCDDNNAIEDQLFQDLPFEGISELINYKIEELSIDAVVDSVRSAYGKELPANWQRMDDKEIKKAIVATAKKNKWFKRIDYGEFLGTVIFKYFSEMQTEKIKIQLETLSNWIDE